MSVCSNLAEQDLFNLRKLAEQQRNQRALKNKNRLLRQTHDKKLAEKISPITKKLEEVDKSPKILGEIIKESNSGNDNNQDIAAVEIDSEDNIFQSKMRALPNSNKFPSSVIEAVGSLINSKNSVKLIQDDLGKASISGIPFKKSGGDTIQINDNIYN